MTRTSAPTWLAACLVLGGLTMTACGSGSDDSGPGEADTSRSVSPAGSTPTVAPSPSALVDDSPGTMVMSVYDDDDHTFGDTFTILPDGSGKQVIPMPGPAGGGRWSHAGTDLAVPTTLDDGRAGTAVVGPDGTVERVLDSGEPGLDLVCTAWSPDDKTLACTGSDQGDKTRNGIYTVRSTDGGGLQRLTTAPKGQTDRPGDFSPDGSVLVFARGTDPKKSHLWTLPAGGGRATALGDSVVEDPGRYSPDGQTILTSGLGDLLELDSSGAVVTDIHQDASDGAYLFGPVWSPDGSRIAFSRSTSGTPADVWTALPDGTDVRRVTMTAASNEIDVDWGPS